MRSGLWVFGVAVLAGCAQPMVVAPAPVAAREAESSALVQPAPDCWLNRPAAEALRAAQDEAAPWGLRLQVGDCRPAALDVTLVVVDGDRAGRVLPGPLADGEPVDMGPHSGHADVSPDVQQHRHWLRALMERHGWRAQTWVRYTLNSESRP